MLWRLGRVLAEQAVGVLVGAAFPRVVGGGEGEAGGGGPLERGVVMELRAVVGGDGAHGMGLGPDEAGGAGVDLGRPADAQLAEEDVAGLALDEGEGAGAGLAGSAHGIHFPVAQLGARLDDLRPGGDGPFPGQAAAAVVAAVAFPPLFARAAQVGVQGAAGVLVGPDVAGDGFVTDREPLLALEAAGDLLGTPVLAQECLDPGPIRRGELAIPSRARAAAAGIPVGELRAGAPVVVGSIAPDFADHGAPMPPEDPGDGGC